MGDVTAVVAGAVEAADGVALAFEETPAAAPRAVLLHFPGLGTNRRYARDFTAQLASLGVTTAVMDVRGHGESGGDRGYVAHHLIFISDAQRVAAEVAARHPDLPLFLSGVSMGGLIALGTAMAYPERLQGVIAMSPVFMDRYLPLGMKVEMIGRVAADAVLADQGLRAYPTALGLGLKVTSNPDAEALIASDPHRQDEVTLRLYWELLRLTWVLPRHARELKTSLLLLLAGDDRVGWNWASRRFFAAVGQADKQLIEYPDYCHDLTLETHEPAVAEDIAGWIAARAGDPAPGYNAG